VITAVQHTKLRWCGDYGYVLRRDKNDKFKAYRYTKENLE